MQDNVSEGGPVVPEVNVPGDQSYLRTNITYTVPDNIFYGKRVTVYNKAKVKIGELTRKDGEIYASTGIWTPSPSESTFKWTKSPEETKTKGTQYIRIDPRHHNNHDLLEKFGGEENLYVEKGKLTKGSKVSEALQHEYREPTTGGGKKKSKRKKSKRKSKRKKSKRRSKRR